MIGNGDILTPEDAVRMVEETNCDAVMIGRAASSNPWIFAQIQEYLATGSYRIPHDRERYDLMRHYYSLLVERGEPDAHRKDEAIRDVLHPRNSQRLQAASRDLPDEGHAGGSRLRRCVFQP